jgi:hypothetical protein
MTPRIPAGLGPVRRRVLEVALAELDAGAREVPPGSNRGPRVDLYLPAWARRNAGKGPSWCCYFAGWVHHQATGQGLPGGRVGLCQRVMLAADAVGLWVPKRMGSEPSPGDAFIMDTDGDRGNRGHIGIVLRVSQDGRTINTVEGNSGHRVRLGLRHLDDPRILGWVDVDPEDPAEGTERGTIPARDLGRQGTR